MMRQSHLSKCFLTALNISAVVSTFITFALAGGRSETAAAMSVTVWPALRAARARQKPIRPELAFEMKRTGSMYSRVAPAVMRIRIL